MKLTQAITLLLMVSRSLPAQQPQQVKELPEAQITFHATTDDGTPVSNVNVTASTFLRWQQGEGFGKDVYQDTKGKTDKDGITTINFASERGDVRYGIYDVPGYYSTRNLEYQFKKVEGDKWQPWNPTVDVVLKPIINPIAMYARRMGDITKPLLIPAVGQPIGFDLVAGDWVAPHGQGSTADFIFTLKENVPYVSVDKPFGATLRISFSNKGDGIQSVLVPINKGSELRLPRYAPEEGYESTLVKEIGRAAEGNAINSGTREDQNYFFRVRTVLDEDGKIKSALYGKIDGDIQFWGNRKARFNYYLNPNPNDRNMEFDTKQNLAGKLPFNQRVTAP